MSTEQNVKDVLLDMLGEEKRVKENHIPRNVDASYKIFLNLNGKELAICLFPPIIFFLIAILSTALFGILNFFTGFMILILSVIVFLTIYGLLTVKPIPEKENIRMIDKIKQDKKFTKRQKVYFYQSKEVKDDI